MSGERFFPGDKPEDKSNEVSAEVAARRRDYEFRLDLLARYGKRHNWPEFRTRAQGRNMTMVLQQTLDQDEKWLNEHDQQWLKDNYPDAVTQSSPSPKGR